MNAETVVEVGKWSAFVNHLKNNRIEYLVLCLLAHAVGLTDRILQETNGVCL